MGLPLYQVDAFTAGAPFTGNPAAVVVLPPGLDPSDGWRQAVAAQLRLSETAFLEPREDGHRLRWFTPTCEVDLCGHATLASAAVLRLRGATGSLRFETRSGILRAEDVGGGLAVDLPRSPLTPLDAPPPGLLEALGGAAPVALARTRFDLLLELPDEAAVRALAPDFRALAAIDARGVIVTARGADADFVSRFFGPAAGVDEDPVTGSAHCALAPWWAARLGIDHLVGWQASARGGRVRCALRGDRVRLAGETVLAWRGTLELPPPGGP